MFKVVLSDAAKADIRNNVVWWTENRSKAEAERWYVEVIDKIYSLEHQPFRCPIARESEHFRSEIRHLLFGVSSKHTHRILYEIDGSTSRYFVSFQPRENYERQSVGNRSICRQKCFGAR